MQFRRLSMYRQMLILFLVVVILPILTLGTFSIYSISRQYTENTKAMIDQWLSSISTQFNTMYKGIEAATLRLSKSSAVVEFVSREKITPYERYEFIQKIEESAELQSFLNMSPYVHSVYILAENGGCYAKYGTNGWKFGEETTAAFIQRIRNASFETDYGILMQILDVRTPEQYTQMALARRVGGNRSQSKGGLIVVKLDFSQMFSEIGRYFDDKVNLCIVRRNVLALCSNPAWEEENIFALEKDYLLADGGNFIAHIGHERYYAEYAREIASGCRILLFFPESYVATSYNQYHRAFIGFIVGILLLTTLLFFFFLKTITQPIVALGKALTQFDPENGQQMKINGSSKEIVQLVDCYNIMVQHVSVLVDKLVEAERQKYLFEVEVNRAQLQALQMQMNPHFLYNTLSVINTYAMLAQQRDICRMIDSLSNMLRYALQNPLELVSVTHEIEHVQEYLVIQSYRIADMPVVEWDIEATDEPLYVMRMILQPLIENVFQHAFRLSQKDRRVKISVRREGKYVLVCVHDNGNGFEDSPPEFSPGAEDVKNRMGIGLNNVHRRVQILFGSEYGVIVRSCEGKGAKVIVRLPFVQMGEEGVHESKNSDC